MLHRQLPRVCACALALLVLGGPALAGPPAALTPRVYLPATQAIWPLNDLLAQDYAASTYQFLNPPGHLDARLAADCSRSRSYGLRIEYSFSGPGNGGWVATWEHSPTLHIDVSSYSTLIMWAKGSAPNGFHIGLKDAAERESKAETQPRVSLSPAEWRRVAVPLSAFVAAAGPVDLKNIKNVNIGVNASHGAGSICIDNISFGRPLDEVYLNDDGGQEFDFLNPPGSLAHSYSAECRRNNTAGLHVAYSFTAGGNGGWGVHWDHAPYRHFDATPFGALGMWVKGSAPNGFHIGLKDTTGHEVKAEARDYLAVSASEWRKLSVPLGAFADANGPVEPAFVQNINVGFNASHGLGDICIADVAFE